MVVLSQGGHGNGCPMTASGRRGNGCPVTALLEVGMAMIVP